jgi:hypothetical protein
MDKIEFRAALHALNLTQPAAAEFLGYGLRRINGLANGDSIPTAVASLLKLMVVMCLTVEDVPK